MSDTTNDMLPRVAILEQIARETRDTLIRIETRLDRMEARFDSRLERLDSRQGDDFRFLVRLQITLTTVTIGLTLAGLATLGGLMAHGFHWI